MSDLPDERFEGERGGVSPPVVSFEGERGGVSPPVVSFEGEKGGVSPPVVSFEGERGGVSPPVVSFEGEKGGVSPPVVSFEGERGGVSPPVVLDIQNRGAYAAPLAFGRSGWVLVLAAFAIGFANFPLQVVGTNFDHLPGDVIDNRLNNFVLEHGYRYLTGKAESFWDAPSFYPARRATAWSDAHLGMLPVYAASRVVGLSPEHAFLGWFLVPFVLNFAATVWATRRLGFGPLACAIAAYLFTFGLPVVAQLTHAQLFPRFFIPPAVVIAWEGLRSPRTWRLAFVAGCGMAQSYISVYSGYFLALLLGAGFVVTVARFRRQLRWRELLRPGWKVWASRAGVMLVAVGVFLLLATRHAGSVGKIDLEDIRDMAPVPASWVTPPPGVAFLSGDLGWTPLPTALNRVNEHQLAAGILPIVATLLAALLVLVPLRADSRLASVVVGAVAVCLLVVLITRVGGVWLYEPLASARGSGGIRAIGRVVLVLLFPMGVALGASLEMLARAARRLGFLVALALLGMVVIEQRLVNTDGNHADGWRTFRTPLTVTLERQARITRAINQHPSPRLVFAFPSAGDGHIWGKAIQVEVMRAGQDAGVPSVNGWSGYFAHKWEHFPDYRSLMTWLTETNALTPEQLRSLVLIGDPRPDPDPVYEAKMCATHPFTPVR